MGDTDDFSFSGLKTAARRAVTAELGQPDSERGEPDGSRLSEECVAELAWAFQESVVDVLVTKTLKAAERSDARTIVLGGGVAANAVLRQRLTEGARALGVPLVVPEPSLCTDNAAMIASAARYIEPIPYPSYLGLDAYASVA